MSLEGRLSTTLIGSFPGQDHQKAVEYILKACPEIPCWPQLPSYPQEGMLVQFSRGLPGFDSVNLVINPELPSFEEEMLAFYEEYLAVKEGRKALSESLFSQEEDEVPGLFLLARALEQVHSLRAIKGQITGPFTLATSLKTPSGQPVFYDDTLRDIVNKLVAMRAAWQVEFLKKQGLPVVIFLDEPALAGFGSSAFVGVSRQEVKTLLMEVAEEIKAYGGLPGIHVCANTEWDLLIEAKLAVINFDAFDYLERFLLYTPLLKDFLRDGGLIAWGIVPTLKPQALLASTSEGLVQKVTQALEKIAQEIDIPPEEVARHSLLTPSCGMGTLEENLALKALDLLPQVSQKLRERYGL